MTAGPFRAQWTRSTGRSLPRPSPRPPRFSTGCNASHIISTSPAPIPTTSGHACFPKLRRDQSEKHIRKPSVYISPVMPHPAQGREPRPAARTRRQTEGQQQTRPRHPAKHQPHQRIERPRHHGPRKPPLRLRPPQPPRSCPHPTSRFPRLARAPARDCFTLDPRRHWTDKEQP